MMTETDLVKKIQELKKIRPRKDWVVLTKSQILGENVKVRLSHFTYRDSISIIRNLFSLKPALAGFFVVFILFGVLGFAKNSLPGDPLYIIRKVAHFSQAILTPEAEKPAYQLKLANDRLEDLTKASVKNLAPTINEFQASISQATKELSRFDATTSSPTLIKKIVEETKKLKENKEKVEFLGVVIEGTEELDNALGKMVGDLIGDLEKRTLTEEKEALLLKMKELFEEGKYSEALELYLVNQ